MKLVSKGLFKSIKEFKMLNRKLGNGSFGVVNLAMHKSTGRLYAIKVIDMTTVPSDVELKLVEREIRLHSTLQHPHVITLWDTLSEDGNMYMVLEYAQQGNLFFYQNTKQVFTEPEAALFFSQTAKAVEYLHSIDIMHRDLKPENLLLDRHLNIKLCDFGWCAENINTSRTTFCGTYEYMAPEMLFGTSYDYKVDNWALGVLLYELVHGHAPFRGESVNQVKQSMLQGTYQLNECLSDSLKTLITNILKFDPQERLSLKQILSCEWLKAMNQIVAKCADEIEVDPPNHLHILLAQHFQQKSSAKTNSSVKKQRQQTKNISVNLSINNFALIKNSRNQFVSPGQAFAEKKRKKEKQKSKEKDQKRFRTQAEQQLLELAHSLSPIKKVSEYMKSPDRKPRIERKARQPGRRSQEGSSKSSFRGGQSSLFSGSILKKKSVHQKLMTTVNSMKNIHRVKTGQRGNIVANITALGGINH